MKLSTHVLLVALVTGTLLFFTCRFAVSDFLYPDYNVIQLKPWRPEARLWFGAVMVPILLFFTRWYCGSLQRRFSRRN
ncbi:MAG: hypothetical protein JWL59_2278 [Chthoniobacteraceae bacterium]|nr:hypothetical protein [Chthoniobacteraceae bacterium]